MTQAAIFPFSASERHRPSVRCGNSGDIRRNAGLNATTEAERAEWIQRTLFLFRSYVSHLKPGDLFAFEDFRAYTETCKHEPPHSHKMWGAFPRIAVAAGIQIVMTDMNRKAHSPRTNSHRVSLWMVKQA